VVFEFVCASCGEVHRGVPAFGTDAPFNYYAVAAEHRAQRCVLGTDDCIIDEKYFFVRGCIEVPVRGEAEPFSWGVWVSAKLTEANSQGITSCLPQPSSG